MALLEAQSAVKLDSDGHVVEALEAYRKAVELLDKVMNSAPSPEEFERIQAIVGCLPLTVAVCLFCLFVNWYFCSREGG